MRTMIQLKSIRDVSSPQSYTRGNHLYITGLVEDFDMYQNGNEIEVSALVAGSYDNQYDVDLIYDTVNEKFVDYYCECPAYESYEGMCKHCVAVALELYERVNRGMEEKEYHDKIVPLTRRRRQVTDTEVKDLIYYTSIREKARYMQPEVTGNVQLVPILHQDSREWKVEFKIGTDSLYVLKDISNLVEAVKKSDWIEYGKKLKFYHEKAAFTPESQKLLEFLTACVENDADARQALEMGWYYYASSSIGRYLPLTEGRMVQFATTVGSGQIMMESSRKREKYLKIVQSDPILTFKIGEKQAGGYKLLVPRGEVFRSKEGMCICQGTVLSVCSPEFADRMGKICALMDPYKEKEYYIDEEDVPSLCAVILPEMDQYAVLIKPEELEQYSPNPCVISCYFDYVEGCITALIYGEYGEIRYNLTDQLEEKDLYRDIEKERAVIALAEGYFTDIDPEKKLLFIPEEEEEAQYQMLSTGITQFHQLGEVYITDALKRLCILASPKISVGVTLSGGLLDITLQTERLKPGELEGILSGYRKRKKYYRLKNGDFLELEDNGLSAVAELAEGLDLSASDLEEGHILVPEYRSFYLDQVLRENEGALEVRRGQDFKALLRTMKNVEDSDYDIPSGLCAELRPYQKFGYRWLMTLSDLGFGGILADDMGLGKTVQAIAYMAAMKERREWEENSNNGENGITKTHGFLIVCPASLVYNWESEILRFAPGLSIETIVGSASARSWKIHHSHADVFLTSYDLLKRDVEEYCDCVFSAMFIDEAQNIKNHTTQAAKAVKAIVAARRFALTGTPIENTLSELWSIFDFLMPGFLDTYKHFRDNYEQQIVAKQDKVITGRLRKMIRPFILRRLKTAVLKELPDKLEEVVYSRMEDEQREIYEANVQKVLDSLSKQTSEEFRTNKIQILAELTHLRQLCCDPSLVYENYKGGAAKVDTCMELIKSAVESGNKLLVFSQFTSMLDIIKRRLKKEKIAFYLLTGSTSKEKRKELVTTFNKDKTPVFLISLKAGGTGLNLTAASIVIHFDPWWNMAAQNQATDRAHRIGQTNIVTVYRLIMKDTLEEKILKLQERKAGLSEEIIAEGSIGEMIKTKDEFLELLGESQNE